MIYMKLKDSSRYLTNILLKQAFNNPVGQISIRKSYLFFCLFLSGQLFCLIFNERQKKFSLIKKEFLKIEMC